MADIGSILVVCDTAGDLRRERRYLAQLEEQRVQGILITPVGGDDDALRRLSERGTPVVLVDSGAPRHGGCSVTVDDVLGGRLAVDHLLEHGPAPDRAGRRPCRHPPGRRPSQGRARGGRGVGRTATSRCRCSTRPSMSIAAGRGVAEQIAALPAAERPTAAFCANDLLALGLMVQLRELGVRIPDEMGVIGYDDIEFAGVAVPPLSSVRQPRAELGRTAAELLAAELDEGEAHHHRHVTFKPELVIRESTSPGLPKRS